MRGWFPRARFPRDVVIIGRQTVLKAGRKFQLVYREGRAVSRSGDSIKVAPEQRVALIDKGVRIGVSKRGISREFWWFDNRWH